MEGIFLNIEAIEKIKKSINRNCENCINYNPESYQYEEGYTEPAYCSERSEVGNLNSFPFKKEQQCFSVDFHLIDSLDKDLEKLSDQYWDPFVKKKKQREVLKKLSQLRAERYGELM